MVNTHPPAVFSTCYSPTFCLRHCGLFFTRLVICKRYRKILMRVADRGTYHPPAIHLPSTCNPLRSTCYPPAIHLLSTCCPPTLQLSRCCIFVHLLLKRLSYRTQTSISTSPLIMRREQNSSKRPATQVISPIVAPLHRSFAKRPKVPPDGYQLYY